MSVTSRAVSGLLVRGPLGPGYEAILTPDALDFVGSLVRDFAGRRDELLERRRERQAPLRRRRAPDFLPETRVRARGDWTVAPLPADLLDRRVEITGPVDRKMIINALNSGASVFMADFEDSNSPTWDERRRGPGATCATRSGGTISYDDPATGKAYRLDDDAPRRCSCGRAAGTCREARAGRRQAGPGVAVRLRALLLPQRAGAASSAGTGPVLLPAQAGEPPRSAAVERRVRAARRSALGIPRGTIKATVLIETLPAAFEMDEILYELREHSAGLNCGRWDYIFSFIKKLRARPGAACCPTARRSRWTQPFLRAYTQLLIKTCHRRGVHAMGGMAAQIPIKDDPTANDAALDKVRADKLREVQRRPRRHLGRASRASCRSRARSSTRT